MNAPIVLEHAQSAPRLIVRPAAGCAAMSWVALGVRLPCAAACAARIPRVRAHGIDLLGCVHAQTSVQRRTTTLMAMGRILTGQVAIVTGASSGIGAATAVAMARAGVDVLLAARREDRLAAVARAVESVGRRACVVAVDVAQSGSERLLLDAAERHFGRFDIVFANAGYGLDRDVHLTQEEDLRALFEVNFFASVALLRESARRLRAAGRGGHLLMCSSCLSKFSLPGHGAYAASKAAQESICRAMRFELLPHGIEVASVHPITTTTEFFAESAARSGLRGGTVPEHAPRWAVQPPERVADAIVDCLRNPRSEVWTSEIVRLSAALFNACPWIFDLVLRREARRRARQLAREAADAAGAPRH